MSAGLQIRGSLIAVGTVAQPIVFRNSAYRSVVGVTVQATGSATIIHAQFSRFGGALSVPCCGGASYVVNDTVFIDNQVGISGYTGASAFFFLSSFALA